MLVGWSASRQLSAGHVCLAGPLNLISVNHAKEQKGKRLTCGVVLKPDGPPKGAGKPMNHHGDVEGGHNDAACAEAELLS